MSAISEEMQQMYGWTPPTNTQQQQQQQQQGDGVEVFQTLKMNPLEATKEELQTFEKTGDLQTLETGTHKEDLPDASTQEPETLQDAQSTESQAPQGQQQEPVGENGHDDYLYYEEEEENAGESSPEEEEGPDGSGTIKPYIKFSDRFPKELSWSDIKVL